MGVIRQLPPSVINQIAAGEVVERPASVVKELLENAIDAGATRVDVSVERGGKDLVRVADNGMGMVPDDLLLAFQPHATSKLADAEDLYRVRTLGFRGEALAAIAEVSRVRCQTRQADRGRGFRDPDRGRDRRPDQELRRPGRHRDGGAEPVLQHPGAADVPEVGHDRGRARRRDLLADRARPSRGPHDLPVGGQGRPRPAARHRDARADRRLLRPGAGRVAALDRGPARSACTSGAMSPTRPRAGRATRGSSSSWGAGTSATGRSRMPSARPIAGSSWSAATRWCSCIWRSRPRRST